MTHRIELRRKARRLFFAKILIPGREVAPGEMSPEILPGQVLGLASGGGASGELFGDDYLIDIFNAADAPERFGCIDEYYSPLHDRKALTIDLVKAESCCDDVVGLHAAREAEAQFVLETSIILFQGQLTKKGLQEALKIQEIRERGTEAHPVIESAQAELVRLGAVYDAALESLLTDRDGAIIYKGID